MRVANEKLDFSLGIRARASGQSDAGDEACIGEPQKDENAYSAMGHAPASLRPMRNAPGPIAALWQRHRTVVRGAYVIGFTLALWEFVGRYVLTSKLMFAPFSSVVGEAAHLWATGELGRDVLVSFTALGSGFAIAALIGVAIGSLIAVSDAVREHLDPLINALYATPLVALSPILILALGIGPASKIAIVFLLAVFPILINTTAGIKSADETLIEAARSFSASGFAVFRLVLLPSALPFIVAGLRLGIGRGLVGIFIGELFGSREGLGYLISMSS